MQERLFLTYASVVFCLCAAQSWSGTNDPTRDLKDAIQALNVEQVRSLLKTDSRIEYVQSGEAVSDLTLKLNSSNNADSVTQIMDLVLEKGASTEFEMVGHGTPLARILYMPIPVPKKIALVELLMNHGARTIDRHGKPVIKKSLWKAYQREVLNALLTILPLEEKRRFKKELPGLLKALTALKKSEPPMPRDIRRLILSMVIDPLVDEHMDNAKRFLSAIRLSHPKTTPQNVIRDIDEIEGPQSWEALRLMVQINIRRALFNESAPATPATQPESLSKEQEATIDAFVKAYEEWSRKK